MDPTTLKQLQHEGQQDTDTDMPTNWTQIINDAQTELNQLNNTN